MTPEELKRFKNEIADPTMQRLMSSAKLEEGLCFIEKIKLNYIDGRSWGCDSVFEAEGLIYQDGKVQPFAVEIVDEKFNVFFESLRDCYVLAEAEVVIADELNETEIKTTFRGVAFLIPLYEDVQELRELSCCGYPPEYLKMKESVVEFKDDKNSLNAQISTAEALKSRNEDNKADKNINREVSYE